MVSDMQHKLAYDNLHTISAEILLSHSSMHDFDVNSLCKKTQYLDYINTELQVQ